MSWRAPCRPGEYTATDEEPDERSTPCRGGRSSRMGRDKASLVVVEGELSQGGRALGLLRQFCAETCISLRDGQDVYVADCNAAAAEDTVARIVEKGDRAQIAIIDVADEVACKSLGERILLENDGRCDVLVNNDGSVCWWRKVLQFGRKLRAQYLECA